MIFVLAFYGNCFFIITGPNNPEGNKFSPVFTSTLVRVIRLPAVDVQVGEGFAGMGTGILDRDLRRMIEVCLHAFPVHFVGLKPTLPEPYGVIGELCKARGMDIFTEADDYPAALRHLPAEPAIRFQITGEVCVSIRHAISLFRPTGKGEKVPGNPFLRKLRQQCVQVAGSIHCVSPRKEENAQYADPERCFPKIG